MTFNRHIPEYARAILDLLQIPSPDVRPGAILSDEKWKNALAFTDRSHLTLPLGQALPRSSPGWVRERLARNLADNRIRWTRVKSAFLELDSALRRGGIEAIVLKGFAQCPDFVSEPALRVQNDIDLFLPSKDLSVAREIALQLNYEPLRNERNPRIDHLPTMIHKTGWQWRGDYFDPDIPISLDLHFRLWDEATEGFELAGLDGFWNRRINRSMEELTFHSFAGPDALGYACLHALRHLFRGDLRPSHIYEIAWFLERSRADSAFWELWLHSHGDSLRRVQAIVFTIAAAWFGCHPHQTASAEQAKLPQEIRRWLATYSHSPLDALFRPNKDELWLHLCLLDSPWTKLAVLRRRLLPGALPGPVDAVHIPDSQRTWRMELRSRVRYVNYAAHRAVYHGRVFLPALAGGMRWYLGLIGRLESQFWLFFLAALCFDLGLFIYFLLYNVYLLQLGFREDFLGFLTSAMTAGSIAGALLSAAVIRAWGVRRSLLACFVLVTSIFAARAYVTSRVALAALAFFGGAATSLWAVTLSPAIAQLTGDSNRARGFSLIFSTGIAIGIAGGLLGGVLPGWLSQMRPHAPIAANYRDSLLIGCAIVAVGVFPVSRLRMSPVPREPRSFFRPSPFLLRFLIATAMWNIGTGAFNPFFNVYFTRLHMPIDKLGALFSGSQLVQACVVLMAPLVLRKAGLVKGVSGMQFTTGAALLFLMAVRTPAWASCAYVLYMAAQFMSEPGMYTLLMGCVSPGERSSASSLNFFTAFSAQALAASLAGIAMTRFGYAPLLLVAALTCLMAGVFFRLLPAPPRP